MKDVLPLTEDHFVIGNTPENIRLGLDIGGTDIDGWSNPNMTLTEDDMLTNTTPPTSSFIYEYVEVDPLN